VQSGDQLILIVTVNSDTTATTPAGWTLQGTQQDGSPDMTSWVFTRVADGATAGSTSISTLGTLAKASRLLLAYSGASTPTLVSSSVMGSSTTTLTTPAAAIAAADTTVVSYWSDKSSANTGWTLPGDVTSRSTSIGSGGGRIVAAAGDTLRGAGNWPGATATTTNTGAKGVGWTIVLPGTSTVAPPTAGFTSSCDELACTFNGTASTTPNGSITQYNWNFGDGTTGTGATPPVKNYSAAGSYDVTLTVTDTAGATDSDTQAVSVEGPPAEPGVAPVFRAAASANTNTSAATITIPGSVQAGDQLILIITANTNTTATTPAGWTARGTEQDGSPDMTSWVFTRAATGGLAGSSVTSTLGTTSKVSRMLLAYSGGSAPTIVESSVRGASSTAHATPSANVASGGSTVVSYWSDETSSNTGWTLPAGVTSRNGSVGSGGGRIVAAAGDTIRDAGNWPGATANSAVSGSKGVAWTVVIPPSVTVPVPVAAYTSSCNQLACTFNGSSSTTPAGTTITNYSWNYGDGTTATGATPAVKNYAASGNYTVVLTVTNSVGETDTESRTIAATTPPPTAAFTSSCNQLACTFNGTGSTTPAGSTISSYNWNYGDGTSATGATPPIKSYSATGTYNVVLTVTNNLGASDTEARAITVTVPVGAHTSLPPETPRTDYPRITTGEITDLEVIGNRVFIAGGFTSIANAKSNNTTSYPQRFLASYNLDTGLVDAGFRPTFDGGVTEIEASPDGTRLYVVGRFNEVNGVTKRKLAAINPTTGATITGFTAHLNGAGTAVEATNTTVYVGGQYTMVNSTARTGLAAVNATTGAVITGFNNNISGGIGVDGLLTVQALVLTPDLSKLLVVHTGRQIAGQDRYGVGLIDTQNNTLLPWRTRLWDDNLQFVGGVQRIYTGAIAPNGQYFVVGSGSGGDRPPINDTAVAFSIEGGDNMEPLWVSRAFDSIYSIAISDVAVFLGGHFNQLESPTATDPWPGLTNVGYGRGQGLAGYGLGDEIVIRDHIGAIDPVYGKAVEWHPGSNSFEGNKAMIVTPRGVITGGDGLTQGGYNVGRIAFFDFNSVGAPGPNETTITNPIQGRVEPTDEEFVVDGTARATSGINRVQLEVWDRNTNQYLQDNLTTWGAANTINVNLESPGATTSNWSLPLTISGNRRIWLQAKTFATNGSSDPTKAIKKIETFGLSDLPPSTSINGPSGIIPTLEFTMTGSASDDFGVNSINVSIKDAQSRYLQDDGTASATYNTIRTVPDVVGATNTTWSLEIVLPYESTWFAEAIAVDTTGQSDLRGGTREWLVSATAVAPNVTISAPVAMTPPTSAFPVVVAPGSPMTFSGTATDDDDLKNVEITLRNNTTGQTLASDGTWSVNNSSGWYRISAINLNTATYNWSYTTPFNLTTGSYSFSVRATDDLDLSTSSTNQGRLTINVQIPGDNPPDARITPGGTINGVQVLHLDLAGTATDDFGVASVRVAIEERDSSRYLQANGSLSAAFATRDAVLAAPNGTSTAWTLSVDLPTAGDYGVTVYGYDTAGQQDTSQSGATARYPIYPGDAAPVSTEALFTPAEGAVFDDLPKISTTGRFEDDQQMAEVEVAIRNAAGQYMNGSGQFSSTSASWRNAFMNSPGSPGSNFSYTSPVIPNGTYTLFVRGIDQNGFATDPPVQRTVTVNATVVNTPPVANFTYSCTENVCNFDGRSSTDETPATLDYIWSFGQGSGGSSSPVPSRTYTAPGTFTVTLTVRDEWEVTSAAFSQTVTIVEPTTNVAPNPVISPPSCSNLVCNFSSAGSSDPNTGDTFTRLWTFGDPGNPSTSTSTSLSRTFTAAGTYTVTLTLTDGWGRAASTSVVVTVTAPPPP
jgi:PKD repeat protein